MKIRSPWVPYVIGLFLSLVFRLWFATCRKVHLAPHPRYTLLHVRGPEDPERFILCVWHDAVLLPIFSSPRHASRQACCLVSQHQDGSFLAVALRLLGFTTVRGSSKRGGAQAIRQLMTETEGRNIVISPDGPRGPRREIKQGAVYLASQMGRRIVPGAYTASRGWRIKGSWTDMLIPLPFSTVYLVKGHPIDVPPDLSREELESYIAIVQQAMEEWGDYAERIARGEAAEMPAERTFPALRAAA